MPRLTVRVPKYRLHKRSGQAVVTLNGRDFYLGPHGSDASKVEYHRLLAEWQLVGRQHPQSRRPADSISVDELILAYMRRVEAYYRKQGKPTTTQQHIREALRPLHEMYGPTSAAEFGPLALKTLRQQFVDQGRWCRTTINKHVGLIKRMFKWGVENELVPPQIYTTACRR